MVSARPGGRFARPPPGAGHWLLIPPQRTTTPRSKWAAQPRSRFAGHQPAGGGGNTRPGPRCLPRTILGPSSWRRREKSSSIEAFTSAAAPCCMVKGVAGVVASIRADGSGWIRTAPNNGGKLKQADKRNAGSAEQQAFFLRCKFTADSTKHIDHAGPFNMAWLGRWAGMRPVASGTW